MSTLLSPGRIIFAIPFLIFGINHLINGAAMAGFVPVWIPFPVFWIYFVGLCLIAAAISIMTKKYTRLACLLLALLLLIFILTIHLPLLFNPKMAQVGMSNLLKDLGLSGGALIIAGLSSQPEPLK